MGSRLGSIFSLPYIKIVKSARPSKLPANTSKIDERAIRGNLEDVDRLLLNRQNGKRSTIEINSLVVGQIDFVAAETAPVGNMTSINADYMESTVFQRRPWIWTNGLVVSINVVEERCCMLFLRHV